MEHYRSILLADTAEKIEFLKQCFAEVQGKVSVVFHSCEEEDPEELSLLYQPDIVILDFAPQYGDITFMINIYGRLLTDARIIVFTDYAQFSFRSSVEHLENIYFLPRPVSTQTVINHVDHIIKELKIIRERDFSPVALNNLLNDHIPVIRQHYLSMILRKKLPETENVLKKFATLKIDCPGPRYVVIVADIVQNRILENFEAISFLLISSIKSAITERGYQCYVFFDSEFRINGLVGSDENNMEAELEFILNGIKSHFDKATMLCLTVGIGGTVERTRKIYKSFREAEAAAGQAIKENSVVLFRRLNLRRQHELASDGRLDQILELYTSDRVREYEEAASKFVKEQAGRGNLEEFKRVIIRYVIKAIDQTGQWGDELSSFSAVPFLLSRLYAATDLETIEACGNEFTKILLTAKRGFRTQEDYLMEQAAAVINEKIADPSLDLELVSSAIGISKSYFCRLFHKITDQNFSNFVRLRRIEMAKELLTKSSLKTYEVAEAVGFTSPKYFSSVFKQIVGMTPSEYQHGNDVNE